MRTLTAAALLLSMPLAVAELQPAPATGSATAMPATLNPAMTEVVAPPPGRIAIDPLLQSYGSWGQAFRDQWGLYASNLVQMPPQGLSAEFMPAVPNTGEPVVVAVIDTGIDYTHPDLDRENLWRNPGEWANGRDDDGNGLIDDLIGWNFIGDNQAPWDDHGHGTHVAGIIAASNNRIGIAGIAPNVRLMVLKALDSSGHGNGSQIAAAIRYAVSKGVRIINLSLGGQPPGPQELAAIRFALARETLIVTAAGNQASGDGSNGYESVPEVLVVGSATSDGQRAGFSNWGAGLDVLAPGTDILSLRARGSDFLRRSGRDDYQPGSAVVDANYYRATGNSFAAPFVTGLATLILGRDPWLEPRQLQRLMLQNARDLGPVGYDQNHGYGLLDMTAALSADPEHFVEARLTGAELTPERALLLMGTADADRFAGATIEYASEGSPQRWQLLARRPDQPMQEQQLLSIAPDALPAGLITLRLTVRHQNGVSRVSQLQLQLPEKAK